jgi:diguanylate cyclase (GGDEF)-like protein
MILLAITRHLDLVERLRTAFEGAGHRVDAVPDHLHALASEAWNRAHVILVDAVGDPVDGYRFCGLLRGESRILFRNLPIFVILGHPATDADRALKKACDADGFLESAASVHRCLALLGPFLEGQVRKEEDLPVPLLATGLPPPFLRRIRGLLEHFGFQLHACGTRDLARVQTGLEAPLALLGHDKGGRSCAKLRILQEHAHAPYTILVGRLPSESDQRKLLFSGVMDWLPLPLSSPRLLHACRKGMEWTHFKRIQNEYQFQINDLVERRMLLEMETAALRSEVLTDPLTELLNRRAFDQNFEHALNQWERHRRPFVLVLGDLDYFKLTNDRFGHPGGDQVLRAVAHRIRLALRRSDLAFRIGGEEFAILLMETGLQAGADVAEKIRRRIEEKAVTLDSGQSVFPTMSFGVGGPTQADPSRLFMSVDECLYLAKHKGRNRVEVLKGGV